MKYYGRLLALPLFFTALFTSLFIVWEIFNLPPEDVMTEMLRSQFESHGLPILLLSSIIEGMLLIGNYFPGVFVIFLGVIISKNIPEAILAVSIITAGLLVAHVGNYLLGKHGWYRLLVKFGLKSSIEIAREDLIKRGPVAILASYWLPSAGALTDTAAGIIGMPFRAFLVYSIFSTVFWNIIAGFLVYTFKDFALQAATPGKTGMYIMYGLLMTWAIILIMVDVYRRHATRKEN